jgi:VWFA-related protein
MRTLPPFLALALVGLMATPAPAETRPDAAFGVEIDPRSVYSAVRPREGKNTRVVGLQFQIKRLADQKIDVSFLPEEVRVFEDNKPVLNLQILAPSQKLSVVLALDISGSMARARKMEDARAAALNFLDRLGADAEVGLILFDHLLRVKEAPQRDASKKVAHREKLRQFIRDAKPQGGTAYLDATVKATELLRGCTGRKVAIVMTDGVDMNSNASLKTAVDSAVREDVTVYTVGIGEKGKNDPVTTVLVLDRSGSMNEKADDKDTLTKIEALRRAAARFVDLMRHNASTTILSFSSELDPPLSFTGDKLALKSRIHNIAAEGSTRLYDATFAGVETLVAGDTLGKRAVVVLTDGKDEGNPAIHDDDEVVARAKEAKIPLYMLGLGRPGEINEPVMRKMARETGGEYYHAGNQEKLLEVFENLSIELHDDGIDETTLKELAEKTGGKYTHVSELSQLELFYKQLADELQTTYKVTFDSRRPSHDGTARGIDVRLFRNNEEVGTGGQIDDVARGVVVPQMSYLVYMAFLAGLGALLVVPGMFRRAART